MICIEEADPALEHHGELKIDDMAMQSVVPAIEMLRLDNVGMNLAVGGIGYPQVAIGELLAQAISLVRRALGPAHGKIIILVTNRPWRLGGRGHVYLP